MADQVNPTGSLAPGLPLQLLVASAPKPTTDSIRHAKLAESRPSGAERLRPDGSNLTPAVAIEQVNSRLQVTGSELRFEVDKGTGHRVFKLVNPSSGEVLLQVPSEEVLAMARNLQSLERQQGSSGVLLNKEG